MPDVNEEIVRVWMQEQGYLVRTRLKFRVTENRGSPGWSDIDIIGYNLHTGSRVAVDISAWMSETIIMSYLNPNNNYRHRLLKMTELEARNAIRNYFGIANNNQYESWLVVSKISEMQRNEVENEIYNSGIDRIIEFREIMGDLIDIIRQNPTLPRETESLQTIRALILTNFL